MAAQIQTAWCVFTGVPCSGKSTTLNALKSLGYKCVPEAARDHIEKELAKGHTLAEIRRDEGAFQIELIKIKLAIESGLLPQEVIFLDRAIPDSISYLKIAGLDPGPAIKAAQTFHYNHVFIFDPLPFQADGVRTENDQTISVLDKQLDQDYRDLGYDVIHIPVMPVQARLDLILQQVAKVKNNSVRKKNKYR